MALLETLEKQGNFLFKYRGVIPFLIVAPGFVLIYNTDFTKMRSINEEHLYEVFCFMVSLLGLVIRMITVGYSAKNTSGRNTQRQMADSLNTAGMYSIVRHPLYLANYLMWLGLCMRTADIWFILLVSLFFWIYYERIMFAEEQFLRAQYGSRYVDWANSTPTFFPDFRKWVAPDGKFNVKKVIVQERTGILVLFLVFFLTELLISKSFDSVTGHEWLWSAGLSFGIANYVLLKYVIKL